MNAYNPVIALVIFLVISVLIYLIFRPVNGWFWLIKNTYKHNEKTLIEDVLKQLYLIEDSENEINLKNLTGMLKSNNHKIVDVIKKMAINNLVYLEADNVKLTNEGRDYALRIVRVHRLWERYLADKTGFKKEEWHDRAELMEHKLSHEETNVLASQLGNPMFDPHGDPIPTHTGEMAEVEGVSLPLLKPNTIGVITHIEDEPDIIYKQIVAENIHIGSQIRIVENNAKRIVFHAEGEEFVLAPIVAANLTIAVLEKDDIVEDDIARLSSLKVHENANIIGISKECRGENRRRLLDLGFVKGADISIDLLNPLPEPTAYLIKGTVIALRKDQASKILIKKN